MDDLGTWDGYKIERWVHSVLGAKWWIDYEADEGFYEIGYVGDLTFEQAELAIRSDARYSPPAPERATEPKEDLVNEPPHYKTHPSGIECIEIVKHMNFCRGNAMKYLWRAGHKGDEIEDLEKAGNYIQIEIDRLKASGPTVDTS